MSPIRLTTSLAPLHKRLASVTQGQSTALVMRLSGVQIPPEARNSRLDITMKVLVVGGGTAGLIMATVLKRKLDIKVDVVRSDEIGIVGVGEGSTEHFGEYLKTIGLDHYTFMKFTDSTFKSGIMFDNWNPKRRYLHNIGERFAEVAGQYHYVFARQIVNNDILSGKNNWESMINRWFLNRREEYAYNQFHFDTYKMNDFLTYIAEQLGITFFNDKIEDVVLHENGSIQKVVGEKREYRYDFYVDATGFKRILMNKLGAEWESFGDYMKMNSAITFRTENEGDNFNLWTLARGMDSGWLFRLPTWNHHGNGYIFDKNYIDSDGAKQEAEKYLGEEVEIGKTFNFDPGFVKKQWIKNCVPVGLASAFVEPLEATSIGTTIQQAFLLSHRLINYNDYCVDRYNKSVTDIMHNIRDFICLHYVTPRRDTDFWYDVSELQLPESLSMKLDEWKFRLPVSEDFAGESEYIMFTGGNFIQVMDGLDLFDRNAIRKEYNGHAKIIRDRADQIIQEERHFQDTLDLVTHRDFVYLIREVFAQYNSIMKKRTLDWNPVFDEKSKNYSIRSILPEEIEPKSVMWKEGTVLDQGREGACVGFGWTAELLAEPYLPEKQPSEKQGNKIAQSFYKRAQKIDEWPGEEYSGTSVLAGAKIMVEDGHILRYRWCFSIEDLRDAVISAGPVVIGVPWSTKMYSTLDNGLVALGGKQVGGHCLTVTGYDPEMSIDGKKMEVFRWRNSWGKTYGLDGSAYIRYEDLASLVEERAEMCIPLGRKTPIFK